MDSRQRWTLATASVASLMVGLDALVVTTALNTIRRQLRASMSDLEWTVNAYTLVFAVLLLTASTLGDRFGRRRMLVTGLGVFTAASAACALAPNIGVLVAARAVQGAGAAMVMPSALALVGGAFEPAARGKAMGIFGGVTGLAILGGPVIGGAVTQGLAWQWIFWLNVPIGVVLIPLVGRRVAESVATAHARRIDVLGLLLSGLGVLGLVWGLVRGNAAGWSSAEVSGGLVAGAVLVGCFVAWEARVAEPMLPLRLFADRTFRAANLAGLLMTGAIFGAAFFIAQYLQAGMAYEPLAAGLRMLPWTATLFVVAPVAGALINRVGERIFVAVGLSAQALGFGWLGLICANGSAGYPELIAPMMLAGVGVSAAMPAAQNAVLAAVPPAEIGTASGVYNTMRQLGGALGVAALAAVFAARGSFASADAVRSGFAAAMLVAGAISAIGGLAGLSVAARRAHEPRPPRPVGELSRR
jgi:EmrB/QacA subfamily drug resistance transporter